MVKSLPANAGDIRDTVSILGSGSSPGRGHGNPLQYSRLENPHGWRSLVGYGVWGLKELHKPEHTQVRIRNSRQGRRQAEDYVKTHSLAFGRQRVTWKALWSQKINLMISYRIIRDEKD